MKVITATPRLIIRQFTLDDAPAVLHFNTPEQVRLLSQCAIKTVVITSSNDQLSAYTSAQTK